MYSGASRQCSKTCQVVEKAGAAYRIRTCDPIITNKGYPRQTALFLPTCVPISPICAVFVRFAGQLIVHQYIGPMQRANAAPTLTTDAVRCANG